jgi:D-inositol-3-phosphate glycosyltransferase
MKRIAMISEHASPLAELGSVDSGGQNVYVAQVARFLTRMGYQVDIFTRRDDQKLPEIYHWEKGVRVIHVPAGPEEKIPKEKLLPHMAAFTEYTLEFIQKQKQPYQLIHAHFWMSAMVAADLKQATGIPFVVTFHALGKVRRLHQGESDGFPDERFTIEERIIEEADAIIAECPQDELDLIYLYDAAPDKIRIIPCGFDPAEMWPLDKNLSREALGIPRHEKVVLQLGRMVPRKGVDTVVRGFARMVKEYGVSGRLLIVGGESDVPDPIETPEIGRLQKIAEEEGVADLVTFIGRRGRKELKHYFSAADVFVTTPWYEPFGITPVEAMACGTPVIGSKVGGIKYTVVDGETGYLIAPDDADALAERLAHLFQNPGELKKLGSQAVKRANEYFTWQKVAEAIAAMYEELISEGTALISAPLPATPVEDPFWTRSISVLEENFSSAREVLDLAEQIISEPIIQVANTIAASLAQGSKVMVCGNGGSAADAQHFAGELVGRFKIPGRRALPVLALTSDTAFLTAWSNDIGYEKVFSRQVEAHGQAGDVLIGMSTTGLSPNLIAAFNAARELDIACIALIGGDGGELVSLADHAIIVPSSNTQRVQEVHLFIIHALCELVEERFAPEDLSGEARLRRAVESKAKGAWGITHSMPIDLHNTEG